MANSLRQAQGDKEEKMLIRIVVVQECDATVVK
jgi:hypothetical protein